MNTSFASSPSTSASSSSSNPKSSSGAEKRARSPPPISSFYKELGNAATNLNRSSSASSGKSSGYDIGDREAWAAGNLYPRDLTLDQMLAKEKSRVAAIDPDDEVIEKSDSLPTRCLRIDLKHLKVHDLQRVFVAPRELKTEWEMATWYGRTCGDRIKLIYEFKAHVYDFFHAVETWGAYADQVAVLLKHRAPATYNEILNIAKGSAPLHGVTARMLFMLWCEYEWSSTFIDRRRFRNSGAPILPQMATVAMAEKKLKSMLPPSRDPIMMSRLEPGAHILHNFYNLPVPEDEHDPEIDKNHMAMPLPEWWKKSVVPVVPKAKLTWVAALMGDDFHLKDHDPRESSDEQEEPKACTGLVVRAWDDKVLAQTQSNGSKSPSLSSSKPSSPMGKAPSPSGLYKEKTPSMKERKDSEGNAIPAGNSNSVSVTGGTVQTNDETPALWLKGTLDHVVIFPGHHGRYIHPGLPMYMGINAHGVTVNWMAVDDGSRNVKIIHPEDENLTEEELVNKIVRETGVPTTIMMREMLSKPSWLEAVEWARRQTLTQPNSWFVCDPTHRFIIECTPNEFFVRDVSNEDFCAHWNQFSECESLIKVDLHRVMSSPARLKAWTAAGESVLPYMDKGQSAVYQAWKASFNDETLMRPDGNCLATIAMDPHRKHIEVRFKEHEGHGKYDKYNTWHGGSVI